MDKENEIDIESRKELLENGHSCVFCQNTKNIRNDE